MEEVGKNLELVVLDEEAVVVPPSMEAEVLDTLHESHQAVKAMMREEKGSITFLGIRKSIHSFPL